MPQFCIHFCFVFVHLLQHGQFLPDLYLLQRADLLCFPPFFVRQLIFRQDQVVAVDQALQPISDHGAHLDQPVAIRDHPAQLAHFHRRHPHLRHNVAISRRSSRLISSLSVFTRASAICRTAPACATSA